MDCSHTEMQGAFVAVTSEPENSAFAPLVCCASTNQEAPFPVGQPRTVGTPKEFPVAYLAWLDRLADRVPSDHGSPSAAASSAQNQDEINPVGLAHDLKNPDLKNPDLGRLFYHASQVRLDREEQGRLDREERFVRLGAC